VQRLESSSWLGRSRLVRRRLGHGACLALWCIVLLGHLLFLGVVLVLLRVVIYLGVTVTVVIVAGSLLGLTSLALRGLCLLRETTVELLARNVGVHLKVAVFMFLVRRVLVF
jgi:hypothetical protein